MSTPKVSLDVDRLKSWVRQYAVYVDENYGVWTHFHVLFGIVALGMFIWALADDEVSIQWAWLALWGGITVTVTPWTQRPKQFFLAGISTMDESRTGFFLISTSTFIAWVFAKSVYNASTLGAKYGVMGGLSYACWYTSFATVAITVWRLRKANFKSFPEAINARYGPMACVVYALAILYRLEQEVWSNALVVADFYGDTHDDKWWIAVFICSAIPALYIIMSGLTSSIYTDVVQACVAVVFLVAILICLGARLRDSDEIRENCKDKERTAGGCNMFTYNPDRSRDVFSLEGGVDLAIIGLIQGLTSYGFFDPVLTDRAFLLEEKTMVKAYITGGTIAAFFIFFFSLIGVYGAMVASYSPTDDDDVNLKLAGGLPAAVADYLGGPWLSIVNIIFITSSISTVDSTFTSTTKIIGPELYEFFRTGKTLPLDEANDAHMHIGRWAVVAMLVLGLLPLTNPEITALSATTSTGTLMLGLGPPLLFLVDLKGYRPLCFHVPFFACACLGCVYMMTSPSNEIDTAKLVDIDALALGEGSYASLLGVNVYSLILGMASFWLFSLENYSGYDLVRRYDNDGVELASYSRDRNSTEAAARERRQQDEERHTTHELELSNRAPSPTPVVEEGQCQFM